MFKKALIFGNNKHEAYALLHNAGLTLVEKDPDLVVCYGGDGTFLHAEHAHPGIPKLMLRDSRVCKLCPPLSNEVVIARLREKKFKKIEIEKLECRAKGKTLYGVNDIVVHNKDPRHAMRYTLSIDGVRQGAGEIIGDGIVAATPLGSTGYYRSIADSFFEVGIGLAFNNSTEQLDHMVLTDERKITLHVVRGPAVVYADNQSEYIELEAGEETHIVKSKKIATMVRVL